MKDQEVFDGKCREEWLCLILSWVHNENDRNMLIRKYLDGLTVERVAEEFDISVNHCQKRLKKAKTQLFKHV